MDYEQRVNDLLKTAMKAGDKTRLMAVRAIKSSLMHERTRTGGELDEERAVSALASHRKKMLGALDQYRETGRQDLVDSAEAEIAVADELLPAQADEQEIAAVVDALIAETGASSMQEMGKVMGPAMQKLKGRADGNLVRKVVSAKLGGGS